MEWRGREFVSVREAVEILSESKRTYYRRVAEGIYPAPVKNGSRSLVVVDWLRCLVDRRKKGVSA